MAVHGKIMLARAGHKDWRDTKAAKDYVRYHLGRSNGDTFLTELSPIPTRRTADMSWMSEIMQQDSNLGQKIEDRNTKLKELLKISSQDSIICYGKRANNFGELIDVTWVPVTQQISRSHNGKCLLLPFFGNGQMSHAVIGILLQRGLLQDSST
ncbi:MAG: hypothetical protein ABI177_05050 [Edaphobacter sp.]